MFFSDATNDHPVLAPVFIAQLGCMKDLFLSIASNATSRLSGVDADLIHNALAGHIPLSSLSSLHCIGDELAYFKNNFTNINMLIIPYLQSISQQSTADTSTCFNVYGALLSYFSTSISLLIQVGTLVTADTASFGTVNMEDIYLNSLNQVDECLSDILGIGFGAVLNADGNLVNDYMKGTITTLPHPFSCITSIIDFGRNILNQALTSFNAGTSLSLNIPPFPDFNVFG